ncbi:MAG: class II fructose-bisphosphate aldolase [Planctomycetia bacterium]|nr:class II fructose-bisphosphate aldolase [Planctomycetia bacterium]
MLTGLKEILAPTLNKKYAIPAFNVYNMETVMGIVQAAQELRSPIIMQSYSRLFASEAAFYLAPSVLAAAHAASVPICFHLDHGAGEKEVVRGLRWGCSGIMYDCSTLPLNENIASTKRIVQICAEAGVNVEGELGHIGSAADDLNQDYTDVAEAERFVAETGIVSLAVQVGTAHGHYKKTPKVNVERIGEISAKVPVPLVLHGGSGIPEEQIVDAIAAGIRKVNFGTDVCYSFLDKVFETPRSIVPIDVFMRDAIQAVKEFALQKIRLLGSEGKA